MLTAKEPTCSLESVKVAHDLLNVAAPLGIVAGVVLAQEAKVPNIRDTLEGWVSTQRLSTYKPAVAHASESAYKAQILTTIMIFRRLTKKSAYGVRLSERQQSEDIGSSVSAVTSQVLCAPASLKVASLTRSNPF